MGRVPSRSEVPAPYKWRLEDLFPSDTAWEESCRALREKLPGFRARAARLGESGAALAAVLQERDNLALELERLFVYARLLRDQDTTDPRGQALADRAGRLAVEVEETLAFVAPEILALPPEQLAGWLETEPALAPYRRYLSDLLRSRPHVLSRQEEELLAALGEVTRAPHEIFTMLNDADFRFGSVVDEQGREVEVTHGRFGRLMESPDRRVRQETFHALYSTYARFENSLAAILNASVKRDAALARLRRFPSALAAGLFPDDVPVSVYDGLIRVVRAHLPSLHRYLDAKRRLLGLDELHLYDLYVPVAPDAMGTIPYEEAVRHVREALAVLGEEYAGMLARALEGGWVDVFENRGKRSGAYSWGAYGVHPYVLLNYQETVNSLFTLAHELGHALHTHFSDTAQPYIDAQYTIFTAEVASTVNEVLLLHHLLETAREPRARLYLLNHFLEDFRTTFFRQVMFAEFERLTHQAVEEGEALTPGWLKETYYRLVQEYHGPATVADEPIALEWARIPHFYTPFYVYKYATGFSVAVALARRIREGGREAAEAYLELLRAGCSDYPLPLLARAGVDLRNLEPVEAACGVFEATLAEFEEMAQAGAATP